MAEVILSTYQARGRCRHRVIAEDGTEFTVWTCPYPEPELAPVEGYRLWISHATQLSPDRETAITDALEAIDQLRRGR